MSDVPLDTVIALDEEIADLKTENEALKATLMLAATLAEQRNLLITELLARLPEPTNQEKV